MSEWKDKAAAALVRGLISFFSRISLDASGNIGDFCGSCAYFLLHKKKRIAYWNIRAALGTKLDETARRRELLAQFKHLGRNFSEVLTFEKMTAESIRQSISTQDWHQMEKADASKKGTVLLTAHYGNWELMQIYSGLRGIPIHVLGRDQKYPQLNEILMRQREVHGSVAVSRGMNARFILKALREGKFIGMLGDQSAGRDDGILLPFFGRKTSIPTGAFELARRTNASILPCFMIRDSGKHHTLYIGEPLPEEGQNDSEIIRNQAMMYLKLLEAYIEKSPQQWLWQNKRWKYLWTRRIVVLSDGKPGHFKQSQAVAQLFSTIDSYHGRPGLEFETKTIKIEYHSQILAKIFFLVGWLFLPWIRGRFEILKFFFKEDSIKALMETQADFIIAAGSSLAPLQHLFAAETGAKKIVLMRPGFPYCFFNYDLAIVPAHDEGILPKENFQTLISASGYSNTTFQEEAAQLACEIQGGNKPFTAVFIGGKTREFDWTIADAEKLLSVLERSTAKIGGYILTTSRRTSIGVERFFKHQMGPNTVCRKLVIANEDSRDFIAKGMLELAEKIIVTEDSLAMISEAVASGKPVIVLRTAPGLLPEKHRRFLEKLIEEKWVTDAGVEDLERVMNSPTMAPPVQAVQQEKQALIEALRKLL